MPYLFFASCLPSRRRHVIIILNSWPNTAKSRVRRPRNCVTFILLTIDGHRPNYPFGTAAMDSALTDVVQRGLFAAGIPSMLEPSGLDCGDGKRPVGITVHPYSHGRCLVWGATCVNAFASLNVI